MAVADSQGSMKGVNSGEEPSGTLPAASFEYVSKGDRWEWSSGVSEIHGYGPRPMTVTTELVLGHKHPDDATTVAALLEQVRREGRPFSSRHRIVDVEGRIRRVVVVGGLRRDQAGAVIGTTGFYIDVTADHEETTRTVWDVAVAAVADSRGAIEQAKGMLMLVYGISADRAFDILKWRSQETNTKLRDFAALLVRSAPHLGAARSSGDFDNLLLTAHENRGA